MKNFVVFVLMITALMLMNIGMASATIDITDATIALSMDNSTFNGTHYADQSVNGYDLAIDPTCPITEFGVDAFINEGILSNGQDGAPFEAVPFALQSSWTVCAHQEYLPDISNTLYLIGSDYSGVTGNGFDVYITNGGDFQVYFYDQIGNDKQVTWTGSGLVANESAFYCFSVNSSSDELILWKNGTRQVGSVDYDNGWSAVQQNYTDGVEVFFFAYDSEADFGNAFDGIVDELLFFNGAAAGDAEVQELYDNVNAGLQYSDWAAEEEVVASSSSGGTRYIVDEDGNLVGVQQNNQVQLLETPQESSPFLSVGGGSSFDLAGWLKSLWASFKEAFVK